MIIWGYRPIEKELASGHFLCPNCNVIRPYKHKRLYKYYTLFFLPLIPIKKLADYIECQGCFRFLKPEILELKLDQIVQNMGKEDKSPNLPNINYLQSNFNAVELWKSLYQSLDCDNILESKRWPPNILGCAECMKRAGASVLINDYETARSYLKKILSLSGEWFVTKNQLAKEKLTPHSRHSEFEKKYLEFARAADSLLTKMP